VQRGGRVELVILQRGRNGRVGKTAHANDDADGDSKREGGNENARRRRRRGVQFCGGARWNVEVTPNFELADRLTLRHPGGCPSGQATS